MDWLTKPLVQPIAVLTSLLGLISGVAAVGKVIDGDSLGDAVFVTLGWAGVAYSAAFAASILAFGAHSLWRSRRPAGDDHDPPQRGQASLALLFGAFTALLAVDTATSGRDDLDTRVLGAIGLLLALLATIAIAARRHQAVWKKCLDCAESVKADARVCRYCGYRFAARPPDGTAEKALSASGG